jgi:hypothetical protein
MNAKLNCSGSSQSASNANGGSPNGADPKAIPNPPNTKASKPKAAANPNRRLQSQSIPNQPKRIGRPIGSGHTFKPEFTEQAYKLALLMAKDEDMADFFHVTPKTFAEWKARHRPLREAIARGGIKADAEVAEQLKHRAMGYSHEAVRIFMPAGAKEPVYAPYIEHYPPDTQAASLWLRNRQRGKWRDKQDVEHSGEVGLVAQIIAMTPAERHALLLELHERARLTIEHDDLEDDESGS